MFIPTRDVILEMNPIDFEKYCLKLLCEQMEKLDNVSIEHNVLIHTDDGKYQIDGTMEFDVSGIKIKILIECKHHKNAIKREEVQLLYDKIRTTGYNKGILISTSNFQAGAIEYASKHGIALIQIAEAVKYEARALNVIMNSHSVPPSEEPYMFVMQEYSQGITCKYLSKSNRYLSEFIVEMNVVNN